MKNLLLLIIPVLFSCNIEEPVMAESIDTCKLGYTETLTNSVAFNYTGTADTVHFSFINIQGYPVSGYWVDGQINWDCIGFSMYSYSYTFTVWTDQDKCTFFVPSLIND